ncbi:unnamed protein product [Prorocentrum cordatum]|uniref:Uncharacterized protein n=1 Tax=Prorocentrum cordatum TaxID=2364126 RepID=A0ABN9SQU6_9DINO|nr:unnamed protein product [Polarella glacialis]
MRCFLEAMSRAAASHIVSGGDPEAVPSSEEQDLFFAQQVGAHIVPLARQRQQHFERRTAAVLAAIILGIAGTIVALSGRAKGGVVFPGPVSEEASSLGVAVCILGQMARLEIDSKIRNIAEPIANFVNVDFFLSLEVGGAVYNNQETDTTGEEGCSSTASSVEAVKEAFAPYFRGGRLEPHKSENVALDRWPMLYKYKHPSNTYSDRAARAKHIANVMSQMRHQQECADLIQEHEESTGGRYDLVLKVRDNTLALRPVVPEKLLNVTEVTFKHCASWGGLQDKVMLLPRSYLEKTLGDTYRSMLAVTNDPVLDPRLKKMSMESKNTEQVLKHVIVANGVPYHQMKFDEETNESHGSDYLPFVDGRCHSGGTSGSEDRWCVVSRCKDCYPRAPWAFNASCSVDMHTGQISKPINFLVKCR